MKYKDFYSELGKLLYAVADIDHVITQKEKKALYDIVKNELVPSERHTDQFNTDVAFYTEMEFEFMDESIGDSADAFNSFIDFVEDHHTAFDERMKKISLRVVKELAQAYYGTNKKEKDLIDTLKERLNKIEVKKDKKKLHKKMH
ncbi:MAG: hypothetical protein K8R85_00740 [Bacteroidetes bacterium]|nr:hypothetical protein [Bacteroidota bacterium]